MSADGLRKVVAAGRTLVRPWRGLCNVPQANRHEPKEKGPSMTEGHFCTAEGRANGAYLPALAASAGAAAVLAGAGA
ncbi:hypothetical protein, partial [Xanthomonas vesicatoria]|uniref:hypothetical protein n=1 Tax=Xanthomonas vesicatoria TaxID=56460 RepID=UPI0019D08230